MSTQKITEFGTNKFLFDLTNSDEYLPREDFHIAWENKKEFLTNKENEILNVRYFSNETRLITYNELSEQFSLTVTRIGQIVNKALATLRKEPAINLFIRDADYMVNLKESYNKDNSIYGNISEKLLDESIDILNLSCRTRNVLKRQNISTIRQLVEIPKADMVKFRNFGLWSLHEVMVKTHEYGIILK